MIIEIQTAKSQDLEEILKLQKLCYIENARRYDDFNIQPLTQTLVEIEADFCSHVFLKAVLRRGEESDRIVGSIRAFSENSSCFIGRVIVDPIFQNRGIGKKLMAEIETRFQNVSRFELFTGYLDKKNLAFYKKLGYSPFREDSLSGEIRLIYLEKHSLHVPVKDIC